MSFLTKSFYKVYFFYTISILIYNSFAMDFFLFFVLLQVPIENDFYVYNSYVPENIEFCANIIHNPSMSEKFNLECDLEQTNNYIMSVKEGV